RNLRKLGIVDILTGTNERGYTMKIDPDEVDLLVFIKNQRQIRRFLEQGDLREADQLLAANLPLNEGPLFGDLHCGEILLDYKESYKEYVAAMARDCFELRLRQGRHREIVTDLLVACQKWPYDEDLAAKLMLALHRCNRRIEALNAYNRLDKAVRDNLGLDVSRWIQKLYTLLLADDECLNDLNIQFSA
ncbi:MAG TPA: BTAD domain-containing putative transcriptional regulator, partial [Candidatus Saccharimonadales bacterium]|nr:BTAD domain-containing putative transcriptional regulator [Candidatus Saccharimonadales bacterium]